MHVRFSLERMWVRLVLHAMRRKKFEISYFSPSHFVPFMIITYKKNFGWNRTTFRGASKALKFVIKRKKISLKSNCSYTQQASECPYYFWTVFIVFIEQDETHPILFSETLELLEKTSKNEANSFFDILSCISIDNPMVHWPIDFILWYYFMHFDWWFNGPLTYWLHFSMGFHVIRLMVQWFIDVLASFFDVLSCMSIEGYVDWGPSGALTY